MTSRCRTLVVMAALGMVLGTLRNQPALALVSLSMLVWIFLTAIHFYVRLAYFWYHADFQRNIVHAASSEDQVSATRNILWVDRTYQMRITISPRRGRIPGLAIIRDLVPETISVPLKLNPVGLVERQILGSVRETTLTYQCTPLASGRARFFGIHFQIQDPQGFFLHERVLHAEHSYRILPAFARVADPTSRIKRTNALPQHGIHQLKRAGLGGELLELREYQPGDPPKSIAWKVSARRDRLMTRQYESEVPIRLTIFVDAAATVYAGLPGRRLIDQSNYLAASISKAALMVGDAVGLVICGEQDTTRFNPAHGDRAFYQILNLIADNALPESIPPGPFRQELIDLAADVCQERYPELLDPKINPPSASIFDVRPLTRKRRKQRNQLANVFAELYDLNPIEATRLAYDNLLMATCCRRFLNDCDRAWVPPVFDPLSSNTFAAKSGVRCKQFGEQLTRSVAHAHDNEVYVLLVNLMDNRLVDPHAEFEQLLPSIRTAIARHHRVIVVAGSTTQQRPERVLPTIVPTNSGEVLERAELVRITRLAQHFGRHLRSVGASFAISGSTNVVRLAMAEAELAGTGRKSMGGRRR